MASGVTISFETAALPLLDGALELAMANSPGGTRTNEEHFGSHVEFADHLTAAQRILAFDPQTSGGLLVSVGESALPQLLSRLADASVPAHVVGTVLPQDRSGTRIRFA